MSPAFYKTSISGNKKGRLRVLGIAASPRRNGNSEILLDKVLAGASSKGAKVEKVILNELSIRPCQGCGRCRKAGVCYIKDDMRSMYKSLQDMDAIVVASPVYFGSITAQMKILIDRCQSLWIKNFLSKDKRQKPLYKKGIFISVSGHKNPRFFRNSREIIKIFFAVLGVKLFKELYLPALEHKGEVLKRRAALERAYRYGKSLVK